MAHSGLVSIGSNVPLHFSAEKCQSADHSKKGHRRSQANGNRHICGTTAIFLSPGWRFIPLNPKHMCAGNSRLPRSHPIRAGSSSRKTAIEQDSANSNGNQNVSAWAKSFWDAIAHDDDGGDKTPNTAPKAAAPSRGLPMSLQKTKNDEKALVYHFNGGGQVRAYVRKEASQYVVTLEVNAKELGVDGDTERHLHWLRGRVSDIVEEYKQLTGQLATLEEASEKTAEELRAAKNVADATLVENRMLQEQLKKMGVEKVEIVSALGSARRKLGDSERALAQVQAQAQAEIRRVERSRGIPRMGPMRELPTVRDDLERTLQNSRSEVAGLEKALENLGAEKEALVSKLRDAESASILKAEDLRIQIMDLEEALDETRKERAATKARIETLESAQDKSRSAIDELEAELEDALQKLSAQGVKHREEIEARVAGYEQELEARQKEVEALVKELRGVEEKKKELEDAVAAAEAKLRQMEESHRAEVQGLKAEVASLQEAEGRAQNLSEQLERSLQALATRTAEKENFELIVRRKQEEVQALSWDLANSLEKRRVTEEKLADAQAALKEIDGSRQAELKALSAEVEAWQAAERAAKKLVQELESRLDENGAEVNAALAGYEEALKGKEEAIHTLEATLARSEAEYKSALAEKEEQLSKLGADLKAAEEEREAAVRSLDDARARLSELEQSSGERVTELQAQVAALTAQAETEDAELEKKVTENTSGDGGSAAAEYEASLRMKEAQIGELVGRLGAVQEEKAEIEKRLAEAEGGSGSEVQALREAEEKSRDLEQQLTAMCYEVLMSRRAVEAAQEEKREVVKKMGAELELVQAQKEELRSNVGHVKAALVAYEAAFGKELEALRSMVKERETSVETAMGQVADLERALKEAENEKWELAARAEKLEKEAEALRASTQAELVAAREERDAASAKLEAALAQLAAAHDGNKAQQGQSPALEGHMAELQATYEEAQERVRNVEEALAKATEERAEVERRAEAALAEEQEERRALSEQLEESRRFKEGLAQELIALREKLAQAEAAGRAQVERLQAEVELLRQPAEIAQAQVGELQAQLAAVTAGAEESLQRVRAEYAAGLEEKEKAVSALLGKLRELKEENQGASADLADAWQQVSELEAAARRDLEALQLRVVQLEEERQAGSAELAEARARLGEMDGALVKQKELAAVDVGRLDEVLASLRDEKQQLAASNASLESKLARLDYERELERALVARLKEHLASKEKDQEMSLALIAELRCEVEAARQKVLETRPGTEAVEKRPPVKDGQVLNFQKQKDAEAAADGIAPELKAELIAYNYEVRDQFIDINKTAKEQVEGVQNLIEALVKKGATEHWARAYVFRNMAYERSKLRKQGET